MKVNTRYHGIREYEDKDIIIFGKGLPGFEHLKKFIVFPLEENDIFSVLHSIDEESVGIVTISPFSIEKGYEINLEDEILNKLRIEKEENVLVLSTVTLNSDIKNVTANLKAPIVINIAEGIGEQIILDNNKYLIKHPLVQE